MPVEPTPVAYALPNVRQKTYQQALVLADSKQWVMEIHLEKQFLEKKNLWEVVSTPPKVHLLNTVWVFKRVFDGDGNLVKQKARLCAQGSSQIPGLEYCNTYAPTGAMAALRLILLVGLTHAWKIHHMDAKTAFLNSTLSEDIYLWPAAGLALSAGKCYHLKKSIYGLKQSPQCWYQELVPFFKSIDFIPSSVDGCLFISKKKGWPCLVHVHVDDMTIVSPNVSCFKKLITRCYEMKDLGPLQHTLGVKAVCLSDSLCFSQTSMIQKILVEFGMQNAHSVSTPMDSGVYLSAASDEDPSLFLALNVNYWCAVGLINYLAISTRPDLAFHVLLLSQHLEKPGIQNCWAFKRLLQYLIGTQHLGLTLSPTNIHIHTYANASYANCPSTRHFHTGLLVYLVEYKALYKGGQQILWFQQLLLDMSFSISSSTLSLLGDNQPSISLAKNPMSSNCTMHIDVKYHWLQEKLSLNLFTLSYVPTMAMHAYLLTKVLHFVENQGLVKHVCSSPLLSIELGGELHNNEKR
ncbi:hypothetical protein O181_024984 [Austropuccinia psidii MF-1]|uniref:Reverse transcriptase Ty1/copia-type domain-containing protein n=1 Tax=Austropuccinia psidii MF-1 TaxID=1389203 RepID=A0A9Q3CJP0_9BASI|nr:hypothetical protein [Austropuccinia psidii MF-1]